MNKYIYPLTALLLCAALAIPCTAQEEVLPENNAAAPQSVEQAPAAARAPAAAKKKIKKTSRKKPQKEPVSQYKFRTTPHTPAYKFDRQSNPILPKKSTAKKKKPLKKSPVKVRAQEPAASPEAPLSGSEQDLSGQGQEAPANVALEDQ